MGVIEEAGEKLLEPVRSVYQFVYLESIMSTYFQLKGAQVGLQVKIL